MSRANQKLRTDPYTVMYNTYTAITIPPAIELERNHSQTWLDQMGL